MLLYMTNASPFKKELALNDSFSYILYGRTYHILDGTADIFTTSPVCGA